VAGGKADGQFELVLNPDGATQLSHRHGSRCTKRDMPPSRKRADAAATGVLTSWPTAARSSAGERGSAQPREGSEPTRMWAQLGHREPAAGKSHPPDDGAKGPRRTKYCRDPRLIHLTYSNQGVRPLSLASPPAAPIARPPIDTRPRPTVITVRRAMPAPPTVKAIHSRAMPASPTVKAIHSRVMPAPPAVKAIHSRAMPASPTIKAIDPRPMPAPPASVPPKYLSHVRFIRLSRKEAWASGHRIRRGAKSGGNHCYKGGGYDRSTHAQLLTIRRYPCVIRPLSPSVSAGAGSTY
jgi:hypothetical protein